MRKILFILTGLVTLFAACKPNKEVVENTEYEKLTYGDPKYSYLKILNLSPGSPVVNFYIDGNKFSSKQSTTGTESAGYTYNQVFPDINYAVTSPGNHTLTAKIIPTATVDPSLEVFNNSISPAAGKYYSLVINGSYDVVNKKIPTLIALEDISPKLDTTKVFVRMVNVYNGGPNLDLVRGTTPADPKVISNIPVGGVTDWVEISSPGGGPTTTSSFLFVNSADNTAIGTAYTPSLTKGRAYTLYVRGIFGNTSYPFTAGYYTTFY